MSEYRKNVAAIIINNKNQIWLGERFDRMAWGFPQGGIDKGETAEEALHRELHEELAISADDYEIIAEHPDWLRYDFPAGMTFKTWTYKGQEQKYFLIRLTDEAVIDLEKYDKEFLKYKWVDFESFPYDEVGFKVEIYRAVLEYFGNIL